MKYENLTKEHLLGLINKGGESGQRALQYILYNAEADRLHKIYLKSGLEKSIMYIEEEEAIGNFYLYLWNGGYLKKLNEPAALGAWIGRVFSRFLCKEWQTIKKLKRAVNASYEDRYEMDQSEQQQLARNKSALVIALINQKYEPERRITILRYLLKGYLKKCKQKQPEYELTDADVASVMRIKYDRYRQWLVRLRLELKVKYKKMNPDQLVCQLTTESLEIADSLCTSTDDMVVNWLKQLIEQSESELPYAEDFKRLRKDLKFGIAKHCVTTKFTLSYDTSMTVSEEEPMRLEPEKMRYAIPEPSIIPVKRERKSRVPERKQYKSVLEQMLGI